MRVIGYTETKEMVEVDLSVDEIVNKQIDIWRLDLFATDPVVYTVGNRTLNFQKLSDIAFAYRTDGETVVCKHDGRTAVAMRGPTARAPFHKCLRLHAATPSSLSFWQHLHWYLTQAAQHETCFVVDYPEHPVELFPPQPSDRLRMRGNVLEMEVPFSGNHLTVAPEELQCILEAPLFMGEMLTERRLLATLPEAINWVFHHLDRFAPVVKGEAIRKVMDGSEPEVINIWVNKNRARDFKRALATMGNVTIEKEILDGCDFRTAHGFYNVITPESNEEILDLHRRPNVSDRGYSSADGLYCVGPNEIRGTRIAFFDAGQGQGRAVGRKQLMQMRIGGPMGIRHSTAWAERGLRVVTPIRGLVASSLAA